MLNDATSLTWQLYPPPGVATPTPAWLVELSEMRGRVLYAEGRRPAFRLANGRFADPDPLDVYAYHLVAYAATGAVGCIRLVPLADLPECFSEHLVGHQAFAQALDALQMTRPQAVEGGRWMVVPEYRHISPLAINLAAGIIAVGRQLGYKILIGPTGTRDRQADFLIRIGMQAMPVLLPVPMPVYDDEIQFLYINPSCPNEKLGVLMNQMAERLALAHLAQLV